jgi:hypothetical protein
MQQSHVYMTNGTHPEGTSVSPGLKSPMSEPSATPQQRELIQFTYSGYLSDSLRELRESGHPEFEARIRNTAVGESAPFSDEELADIEQLIPDHYSRFMSAYATARWGGDIARAVWYQQKEGRYSENIAAKFWFRLTAKERNDFYLRMTREQAERFWNENKRLQSEPEIRIVVEKHPQLSK